MNRKKYLKIIVTTQVNMHRGTKAQRHKGAKGQRHKGTEGQRHKEKMKKYRDLLVWQKSMTLVAEIYKISKGFPKFVPLCLLT